MKEEIGNIGKFYLKGHEEILLQSSEKGESLMRIFQNSQKGPTKEKGTRKAMQNTEAPTPHPEQNERFPAPDR
ncbi:predicted protein [Coccidioides posadasii str. Silveira]|uniref:Predicted protein n=1 Tax=Coccidioides posadasii (strain RMSCC 757 / Silveira) TaxID=443226 RepID=E9D096_COCPS|nr:predicted protein [Coccidioides posadasii str. Silveira]